MTWLTKTLMLAMVNLLLFQFTHAQIEESFSQQEAIPEDSSILPFLSLLQIKKNQNGELQFIGYNRNTKSSATTQRWYSEEELRELEQKEPALFQLLSEFQVLFSNLPESTTSKISKPDLFLLYAKDKNHFIENALFWAGDQNQ